MEIRTEDGKGNLLNRVILNDDGTADDNGAPRQMTPGELELWQIRQPSLAERTGIDTFEGAPDKVAVSLGALALRDAAIGQLWKMAMQAIVEAGDDDTALLAALRSLPAMYAAAELRGTVAMQIIDNDQAVAEEMMVGRVNAVRVKAEAWVRTEEGQAFVKALTES